MIISYLCGWVPSKALPRVPENLELTLLLRYTTTGLEALVCVI